MTKFLFLRHGESTTNKGRRFCGQFDSPLSENGLLQAQDACEYIVNNYKIDKIYASDLTRVKQTIAPTAEKLGIKPTFDSNLREIDVGDWQGKLIDEIREGYPETFKRYASGDTSVVLGNKESFEMVHDRAKAFIDRIVKENDGKTVLVAAHGGVIRMLVEKWLNITDVEMRLKYDITNASLTEVDYDGVTANINYISKNEYIKIRTKELTFKDF